MSIDSRSAGPQDDPFLFQLALDRFCEELPLDHLPPALRESILKVQIEGQRTTYAAAFPGADHLILLFDSRPVGRLLLDRGAAAYTIVDLLLDKDHRGKGIGGAILSSVCREADQAGKPIRLTVRIGNPAAELYRRLGFRIVGTQDDRLLMERPPATTASV